MDSIQGEKKNVIGVLGGMGPLATQLFYGMIIENTEAACDQDHIDMIILNSASTPDRTKALLSGDTTRLYSSLLADCVFLEKSGVSHIVIPCNTSHFFADRLQAELKTPIINMIRAAAGAVCPPGTKGMKVGILATEGTVKTGLYQTELEKAGHIPVVPSEENQKLVMKIIYEGVKAGGEIDFSDFEKIEKELIDKGCMRAIMGCTELSCFMNMYKLPEDFYFDAMKTLALNAIIAAGGKIKKG